MQYFLKCRLSRPKHVHDKKHKIKNHTINIIPSKKSAILIGLPKTLSLSLTQPSKRKKELNNHDLTATVTGNISTASVFVFFFEAEMSWVDSGLLASRAVRQLGGLSVYNYVTREIQWPTDCYSYSVNGGCFFYLFFFCCNSKAWVLLYGCVNMLQLSVLRVLSLCGVILRLVFFYIRVTAFWHFNPMLDASFGV